RQTWLIDHGAALYFHHSWPSRAPGPQRFASQPLRGGADGHVLGALASDLPEAHAELAPKLTPELVSEVLDQVPDEWFETADHLPDAAAVRTAYRDHLLARVLTPHVWLPGGAA